MTKLTNPLPLFLDGRGALLDAGYIYVGIAHADPETDPIACFWDAAMTIPAAQPLRTLGGVIVNGMNAAFVFFAEEDYSLRIKDADDITVAYIPSAAEAESESYQPLDDDLTAIAAEGTTAYGRSLLLLANQAALKAATGIPDCLPLTGGTMSGGITRAGSGAYGYALPAALTGFRLCGINPSGTADATSQPGDWQAFY